jgi:hypothetical protein
MDVSSVVFGWMGDGLNVVFTMLEGFDVMSGVT